MTARKPEPFLSLGFAAIDWVEHYLIHGPGDVQGQAIELDDEFAAFIVKAYRVDAAGARQVRRAFLSRSKGRSKSGLAAMIACFEALGPCRFDHFAGADEVSAWGYEYEPGEPVGAPLVYAEVLNVATEEGQAGNTYDAIFYMLHPETCSPELLRDYGKIDVGVTRTVLPKRRGFIEPITSADSSKDGGKSTFIVADETHLWVLPRLKRLHGIMTRNLLKRKIASGWMLETSTMYGEGEESVAEGTHAYAKSISNGRKRDRTLLFDHRQASDKWDLTKRPERLKALQEAYGPAGAWMNLEAICDSWDDPQVSEAEFRRYWLNQPVPTLPVRPSIFGPGKWDASAAPGDEFPAVGAIGVAVSIDRLVTSIGSAGLWPDGRSHVGATDRRTGVAWAPAEAVRIQLAHGCLIVIDEKGPAGDLIEPIEEAGGQVTRASLNDYLDACALIFDGVQDGSTTHAHTDELDAAVRDASWRYVGDRRAFARKTGDVSMLEAVALANWAALGHVSDMSPINNVW